MRYGPSFDHLSKRELEICGLIAKGLGSEHIANLLHLSIGTVRNYISFIYRKTGIHNRAQLAAIYKAEYEQADADLRNSSEPSGKSGVTLRLVSLSDLPDEIPLMLHGRPFFIGRFDAGVGYKQCDFEFEKAIKDISRRHASIMRTARGYTVIDLNSRTGTFVNGKRMTPGKSCLIQPGDLVSFGSAGAEYVFES